MSARTLADALRALVPATVTRYDGEAPSGATLPWVVRNVSIPDVDSRSEASTPQGRVGRLRLTFAGATENAVLTIADLVMPSLEGARPVAAGWDVSPLRQVGEVRIYPDTDVTLPTGHPLVGSAMFEFTATRTD